MVLFSMAKRPPTRDYRIWSSMKGRCSCPGDTGYKYYGARGIKVCDRWKHGSNGVSGFELFLSDMGPRPSERHWLDRIDSDGDYTPENCRWSTIEHQMRNRRSNVMLEYGGEKLCLTDMAKRHGIRPSTLHDRIRVQGWTVERAIETPVKSTQAPCAARHCRASMIDRS